MTSHQAASGRAHIDAHTSSLAAEEDTSRWLRIAILALALPLFAQTFHYIKDLPPLWALSKAFPILSAPLALALFWRRIPPDVAAWIAGFLWLVLTPSVMAIFAFDQSFFAGLTAQVKLLGMLHAASFLGLLLILRPSLDELSVAFIIWACAIAFALVALWAFAPLSWYTTGYEFGDAPFLSIDHRGPRIRMPIYFLLIGLFFAFRRTLSQTSARDIAMVLGALALAIFVVKTRAVIAASIGVLALVLIGTLRPTLRIVLFAVAFAGAIVLLQLPMAESLLDNGLASGADIRLTTLRKAIEFLGSNPINWLLGVGTFSPLDPGALARFFNHFFFLSDIGWFGLIFEYGVLGTVILLGLVLRVWLMGRQLRRRLRSPFLMALQDFALFVLIISPIYPTMTLQPGEVATIAAIFIYAGMVLRDDAEASGIAAPSGARS